MRILTFRAFRKLLADESYTKKELRYLFKNVKRLDREVRGWFLDWAEGKGFCEKEIENCSVKLLVEKGGLKPVNAFIIMDWLKNEPEEAKYFLVKMRIIEEHEEAMEKYSESLGGEEEDVDDNDSITEE